ncbi:choice-of-anchor Q domain-containing protein [Rhodocaloribacter sp.]
MKHLLCSLVALILFGSVNVLWAQTTRYVAPLGVDQGDCGTRAGACATFNYAIGQALFGDAIVAEAGTYTEAGITVNKDVTIEGAGAELTIVQAAASAGTATQRVFTIIAGVTSTIDNLTIQNGRLISTFFDTVIGGGINNLGTLTLSNCVVAENLVDGAGAGAFGGGISNSGTLDIVDCTIRGNSTDSFDNTDWGGGIYNEGTLTISGSTISGNNSNGSGGGINNGFEAAGPAILNLQNSTISGNEGLGVGGLDNDFGPVTVSHSTIADNFSSMAVGGVEGVLTLRNTIMADNTSFAVSGDCAGTINSLDYNLIEDPSGCTINGTTTNDLTGVDPLLGSLADNGGPTLTHALLSGSLAIDSGICTDADGDIVLLDQRGEPRPNGSECDIGAFELDVPEGVLVTLLPANLPIEIPPEGGFFDFTVELTNETNTPQTVDYWTTVVGPDIERTKGPFSIMLAATETKSRSLTQQVPGLAPAGDYTYSAFVGAFSGGAIASDNFDFIKLTGVSKGGGRNPTDWTLIIHAASPITAQSATLPEEVSLAQNYPNPFNPGTEIRYALPEASFVRLLVYDVMGREVVRLVEGIEEAGLHAVRFDAANLTSGLYVYRLEVGAKTVARTMILLQ